MLLPQEPVEGFLILCLPWARGCHNKKPNTSCLDRGIYSLYNYTEIIENTHKRSVVPEKIDG